MKEQHRVRLGLNEWNRPPAGYTELGPWERIEGGDVQKLNDEWYAEYPAKGLLVGQFTGHGGRWYRKAELAPATPSKASDAAGLVLPQDLDDASVERAARAMAIHSGWDQWDTARTCQHTPNGNEPDEEREYWRDLARVALGEHPKAAA